MPGIDLEALVKTAFNTVNGSVDGVVEACTYKAESAAPSYNATTGAVTQTFDDISVSVIRKKLTIKDKLAGGVYGIPGFQLKTDDRVYLVPRIDLGRTPKVNDKLVLSNGDIFSVVGFSTDPKITASLLTIVVRRP